MTKMLPCVVVGAGGHARVVIDALQASGRQVLFVTDADPSRAADGETLRGVPVRPGDEHIFKLAPDAVEVAIGVGAPKGGAGREALWRTFEARGFAQATVIHPSAVVSDDAVIGAGAQIMAASVIQSGAEIADGVIVNTGAQVDHDCVIGRFAHIAPGSVLCGAVHIGARTLVGAAAVLLPGARVAADTIVPANSLTSSKATDI